MGAVQTTIGKLLRHAFCAALAAFVFGFCLGPALIQPLHSLYLAGMAVSCALLAFVLTRTRRAGRRLTEHATSGSAGKTARQFLWSCVFFAMISAMFGLAVAGMIWYSTDFIRTFGLIFWGGLTCVAIYPVRRDAKLLAGVADNPS